MKKLLSAQLVAARSLATVAHEMLLETRQAATSRVSDLRAQVEDLWNLAGDVLPHAKPAAIIRRVEDSLESLRQRDTIVFPTTR